jgi:phosphoserine aminotransferase
MTNKVYNFNPGPATLPQEVLQQAQAELLDYRGTGISVLEMSHRSKEFEALNSEAAALLSELLGLGAGWKVIFMQGGASSQFASIPLNLLSEGQVANYVVTGVWAEKAYEEAQKFGHVHIAASSAETGHKRVPKPEEIKLSANPAYLHLTSNNTIYGTQWQELPSFSDVPVLVDMSSDILGRPIDAAKLSLIYGGAQKNLGPAGVTVVAIREELVGRAPQSVPTMLNYATHAKADSLYNTPPTFGIYLLNLVLHWVKQMGGVEALYARNQRKAALVYDMIDAYAGFYDGHAEQDSRSLMNIVFRLPDAKLEKEFLADSEAQGFIGLKGHRLSGGIRASLYNAMDEEGAKVLADFMNEFVRKHG